MKTFYVETEDRDEVYCIEAPSSAQAVFDAEVRTSLDRDKLVCVWDEDGRVVYEDRR